MPIPQELTDAMAQVDTATNEVATVVLALRDAIKVNMTPEEVKAVVDAHTAVAARLKGIAQDPNAPVPPGPTPVFAAKRK